MSNNNNAELILPLILLFIISMTLIIFTTLIIISNKKLVQKINKTFSDDCNNYKEDLKKQNTELTKQLLDQVAKQISNSNIKDNDGLRKNLMNVFVKLGSVIKDNCVNAMNQIGAARIAIYLCHNGVRSTHGISFFKISCMCEKVAIGSGVRERMVEHTNIPLNLFDEMIDMLITNNRYIIMNNEDTQESTHKMFISADKIKYTQLVTIYDINNNMLGFVAVEMDKPFNKDEADKEKEVLDGLVKQLVPVLSYSDYSSIKIQ